MIRNRCCLDAVNDKYILQDQYELKKMYPTEDLTEKFILFIQGELWFPYSVVDIKGKIEFGHYNEVKKMKHKLRTPYTNKNIRLISMMSGRKVSNLGYPIFFNTFEELRKIKNVLIKWRVKTQNVHGDEIECFIIVTYDIDFRFIEGKRVYSILTKDCLPDSFENEKSAIKYLKKFSKIIRLKDVETSSVSIDILTESNLEEYVLNIDNFVSTIKDKELLEPLEAIKNGSKIIVYSYYAKEILEPSYYAENLERIYMG